MATAYTGGETLYRGFLPNANDNFNLNLDLFFDELNRNLKQNAFATSVDTLVITAVNESGGSTNMRASLGWEEFR